jgi:hypothetical protein
MLAIFTVRWEQFAGIDSSANPRTCNCRNLAANGVVRSELQFSAVFPPLPISPMLVKFSSCFPPRGAIAQLGERLVRNEEVIGSIPISSTKSLLSF